MRLLKSIILLSIFTTAAHAQFVTSNKRVADVYFQNKEYYAAAEYYKKALQISGDSSSGFVVPYGFGNKIKDAAGKKGDYEYNIFQLANSLRLYNNFKDAESWYAIAKDFSAPEYELSTFWYAESLRANQKFNEAVAAFNSFIEKYKKNDAYLALAKMELASCHFALYELRYPRMYDITRLNSPINEKGSNYAAYLSDDKSIYFTSSRPVGQPGKTEVLEGEDKKAKVTKRETPFLNAIYQVSGNPMSEQVTVQRIGENPKNIETAAAVLHPNGKTMYFTRWDNKGDKKGHQIYFSSLIGTQWSEERPLNMLVNVPGSSTMQPFVTRDGKYLLFSSDRSGGQGKYDLWFCRLGADGLPGQAVNMGPGINTPEDEQAPYYNGITKKLLYSSNGKIGMGGFDFFESEGDFTKWTNPVNLGYPLNSSKDDLYFTSLDSLDRTGYISSDRASLCCLEIFYVKRKYLNIRGILFDCHTQKPIEGARIVLSDSSGKQEVITDVSGRYNFRANSNRKIRLSASKDNYFTKVLNYGYDDLVKGDTLFNPEICLQPFEIDKPIVLENVLYEFDSDKLTEESKLILNNLYNIMVDNMNIEIELSAHTDNIGTAVYNLDLSERRAKSCVDYLTSKGISALRMTSKGYGFTKPIAPNQLPNGKDNPEGRQLNRRTEFKVTKK